MADPQQQTISSAFPAPPPFYTHFTPDNLDRVSNIRSLHQALPILDPEDHSHPPQITVGLLNPPRLPEIAADPELRYLQPPPPPTDGKWRVFGDVFDLDDHLPTLPEQGVEQLFPSSTSLSNLPDSEVPTALHTDKAFQLKKLAKSLLLNFLELLGTMAVSPDGYKEKIDDLRVLFINFYHLTNEYRPHQAREQLILLLEQQLERAKEEREEVGRMRDKVLGILENIGRSSLVDVEYMDGHTMDKGEEEEGRQRDYQKQVWDDLVEEFGEMPKVPAENGRENGTH